MTQSTITGNIGGRNMDIIKVSKQVELDTYQKIDFLIPADNISIFNVRGSDFLIYVDNTLFASGLIIQRPAFNIVEGKNCIKLSGVSELGRLSCERAYSLAYYQDTLLVTILNDLLTTSASGFTLDATNFADAGTALTTIDLRSKETLFSQIAEVIKSYPNLHMRESIDAGGNNILEIGEFDNLLYQATEGINLLDMSMQPDSKRVYNIIEAYGGLSPSVRVSLNDSITDGRAVASPFFAQYPIVVDGNGLAYVENTAVNANCGSVKDFELHKTNNEGVVVQQDIDDASFALYQKAVRYLQQNDESQEFDLTIITPLEFLTVGDRMQVNSNITEEYFNKSTMMYEDVNVFNINDNYRITNVNTQLENYSFELENGIENGILYQYDVRVTNSEDIANYDAETELYERLDRPTEIPSLDALQVAPPQEYILSFDEAVDPSDCVTGGFNGKLYTFDVATTAPAWATGKNVIISTVTPSNAVYEVTQNVANDLTDFVLCMRGLDANANWGIGGVLDEIEVHLLVIYT